MARNSDTLVGVSQATVDDLVRLGVAPRERFRTIPLGLDLAPFADAAKNAGRELRDDLGVQEQEVLLTFVGRVVPIKRVDRLLRSVSLARSEGAPVRLAIVGDGEIRPSLEALARQLGITETVRFLGYRRDLPRILAAGDIAVLSSDNEGTPVSLIEAAAAGRPAVATNVGGVSEVVTADTGILVAPGDEQALAQGIARLTEDGPLRRRMGERARARALDCYSIERLLAEITGLYEELLAPRGSEARLESSQAS
jgi:glycosyltransferase involved in cell wall biosynthesis